MIKIGDKVSIYQKPISGEGYEGEAIVDRIYRIEDRELDDDMPVTFIADCEVTFCHSFEIYDRTILLNSGKNPVFYKGIVKVKSAKIEPQYKVECFVDGSWIKMGSGPLVEARRVEAFMRRGAKSHDEVRVVPIVV